MIYLFMGVSGSGKSTMGHIFAQNKHIPFYDADDFHSQACISKMSRNIPLTDEDRIGWLERMSNLLSTWNHHGDVVLACSALKKSYRDVLIRDPSVEVQVVYLKGSYELTHQRLSERQNHFMSEHLLKSQFDILEEPVEAIELNLELTLDQMLDQLYQKLDKKACVY